jgi:predicted RNase H-like HicB family nuclease
MSRTYAVIYEKGPTSIGAYVPDLPGCIAVAKTTEEVEQLIREAMELHIAGMIEDGEAIPEPTTRCQYVEATLHQA